MILERPNLMVKQTHLAQETSLAPAVPVVAQLEHLALAIIKASSQVSIEALEHSQKVLDHADLLAKRLVEIKKSLDHFQADSRQTFKQHALETCQDAVEIGNEINKSLGSILNSSLDELRELGQNSESLFKDLLEPTLGLLNPFRKPEKYSRTAKAPTIIPISIQDN